MGSCTVAMSLFPLCNKDFPKTPLIAFFQRLLCLFSRKSQIPLLLSYLLAHTHSGGVVWAETTFQISARGKNQIALIFVCSALQVKISQIRRRCVWARNYVGHYHYN
jgi:hypothetical protein